MNEIISNADVCVSSRSVESRLDGVVIGLLVGFDESRMPLVAFPGNPELVAVSARSTVQLSGEDIGKDIALLFENGDPKCPLVIGRIQRQEEFSLKNVPQPVIAELDGKRVELNAEEEIVLRCGNASITLTKAGKILLRGAYLLSRSSGVNRIKGGSVQIN